MCREGLSPQRPERNRVRALLGARVIIDCGKTPHRNYRVGNTLFSPPFARGTMMRSNQIIGDAGSGTHPFWAAT